MKVEFFKHSIGDEEKQSVLNVLDSLFLSTGPKTVAFEEKFAACLGGGHAIGVASCSAGLLFALKALGIGQNSKVIVPAMTFVASANAVLIAGGEVVFCDVDEKTALLDLHRTESLLKADPAIKAIMPVHLYGQMVDMHSLSMLAGRYGVSIIEDCAHCIEGSRGGVRPGALSDAACFSFYATKNITGGEGGAVLTRSADVADTIRKLRLHGMSRSLLDQHATRRGWDMQLLGYKGNMSDIAAALLIPQLSKMDAGLHRREQICRQYERAFKDAGIELPLIAPDAKSARHLFTIWCPDGLRDAYIAHLKESGVGVTVNYKPVHLHSYYRQTYGLTESDYPAAVRIGRRTLSLPLYPKLTDDEVAYVIRSVIAAHHAIPG